MHPDAHYIITYKSHDLSPSIDGGIKKKWYVHEMEHYLTVKKKNKILPFETSYAECSESDTERQIPYDFACMWNPRIKRTNKTEIDPEIQRTCRWLPGGRGRRALGGKGEGGKKARRSSCGSGAHW